MQFKRTLAALLAMVMLVSLLPAAVFAEDFEEPIIEDVDLPVEEAPEMPTAPAAPEETDPPTLPSPEPDPETPDETKPDPQDEPDLELEELREVPQEDEDTLTEIPEEGYSGTCGTNVSWVLDDSGTLTISGSGAMKDYSSGSDVPWYSYRSSVKKVVIQQGVTSIGKYAFSGCSSLSSVNIPDSVSSIGGYAFINCSSLTSISIPDSVSRIGSYAFWGCSSITSLSISSLEAWCRISFGSGDSNPLNWGGGSKSVFLNGEPLTQMVVPDGVTMIPADAFRGWNTITSVSIPDSVSSIGEDAFRNCSILTSVSIGNGVSSIGGHAFAYCSSLKTITFQGTVPSIGSESFYGVTATAYYPANDSTWTSSERQNYGGNLTWVAYNPGGVKFAGIDCTNNQSIVVKCPIMPDGIDTKSNYTVLNPISGTAAVISSVSKESADIIRINFDSPLKAGTYVLNFNNGAASASTTFEITLDLSVFKIVDDRHVIIQLSDAIIGCTDAPNYSFHTLSGDWISITQAVSAFTELGGVAPNVFKLTTAQPLRAGTTYVVETKAMFKNNRPCQGTIAYFTPESFESQSDIPVEIVALTNNQSIKIRLPYAVSGAEVASNYVIKNSARQLMTVGNVQVLGNNVYEINFADPLKADHYSISTRNMRPALTGEFDITLDLSIVRIEAMSVIIQLNEPIYGCTTASNYFVHKLGSDREITALNAASVFKELNGELPNVFRIILPEMIEPGQTYIIETRAMALDPNWEHPCQGTIGYFTK